MTHMDIINRALVAAGGNPLRDLTGTDAVTVAVKAYYERCWKDVLQQHNWTELLVQELMTGIEEGTGYRYDIPEAAAKIESIRLENNIPDHTAKRLGKYLFSQYEMILLTYVSSEGILPIDLDFIDIDDIDTPFPAYLDEIVSLKLAYQIAFKISQNLNVQASLFQRYQTTLQQAKMSDLTGSGGQPFWGAVTENPYGNA